MIDTSATPRVQHTNNCIGNKKTVPQNGKEQLATLPALKLEPALYFRLAPSFTHKIRFPKILPRLVTGCYTTTARG